MHGLLRFTECGWFKELWGIHVISVGMTRTSKAHVTWDGSTYTAIILHNHTRWLLPIGSPRLRSNPIVTLPMGEPAGISNRHAHFVMMNTPNTAYCKICWQIRGKSSWCATSTLDNLHTRSRLMTIRFQSSQQENRQVTRLKLMKTGGIYSKLSIIPWR